MNEEKRTELSRASVDYILKQMSIRAAVASPLHLLLFIFALGSFEYLREQIWMWISLGGCVVSTLIRFYVWFRIKKWLQYEDGHKRWRIGFATASIILGISWGLCSGAAMLFLGPSIETFTLYLMCFGVTSTSLPTYCFNLPILIAFLQGALLPSVLVGFYRIDGQGGYAFAFGVLLYNLFQTFLARQLHQSQIELLHRYEIIERQRDSLDKAHSKLKTLHGNLSMMVESIGEAFLLVNKQGKVEETFSSKTLELFGVNPKGSELWEIMRDEELGTDSIRDWTNLVFANTVSFDTLSELGPQTMHMDKTGRTLKFRYRPVENSEGSPEQLVVIGADITSEVQAEASAKSSHSRAELILKIQTDKMGFKQFLKDVESKLTRLSAEQTPNFRQVRMDLHTLKGTSAVFGLTDFAEKIDQVEREWKTTGDQNLPNDFINQSAEQLLNHFRQWFEQESDMLHKMGVFDEDSCEVSLTHLSELSTALAQDKSAARAIDILNNKILRKQLGEIFESYRSHLEHNAQELGKQVVYSVRQIKGSDPIRILPNQYGEVFRSFVHMLNNAVDHGIEKPSQRLASGKPEYGQIQVQFEETEDQRLRIVVDDDGGGIPVDKLRSKLMAAGDWASAQLPDDKVKQQIFSDGISTAEAVTSISGHGVGMAAVRKAVENVKGQIAVTKSDASGTRIEVILPLKKAS